MIAFTIDAATACRIETIPTLLFLNLTELAYLNLSDNKLGEKKELSVLSVVIVIKCLYIMLVVVTWQLVFCIFYRNITSSNEKTDQPADPHSQQQSSATCSAEVEHSTI
jgi:heme/copper-type cytochrome/quinol oxidase subunit 2